jgi:hypothetical protein
MSLQPVSWRRVKSQAVALIARFIRASHSTSHWRGMSESGSALLYAGRRWPNVFWLCYRIRGGEPPPLGTPAVVATRTEGAGQHSKKTIEDWWYAWVSRQRGSGPRRYPLAARIASFHLGWCMKLSLDAIRSGGATDWLPVAHAKEVFRHQPTRSICPSCTLAVGLRLAAECAIVEQVVPGFLASLTSIMFDRSAFVQEEAAFHDRIALAVAMAALAGGQDAPSGGRLRPIAGDP